MLLYTSVHSISPDPFESLMPRYSMVTHFISSNTASHHKDLLLLFLSLVAVSSMGFWLKLVYPSFRPICDDCQSDYISKCTVYSCIREGHCYNLLKKKKKRITLHELGYITFPSDLQHSLSRSSRTVELYVELNNICKLICFELTLM